MALTLGSEAPEGAAAFVKLISGDKHLFVVEKRVACVSGLIRTMLGATGFKEGAASPSMQELTFPEVTAPVLEMVLRYCHYKLKYNGSKAPLPEFPIPPEIALELLTAAGYFDC